MHNHTPSVRTYRLKYPERYHAHQQVRNAVRRGDLPRVRTLTCSHCNKRQAREYHHSDYSQPLLVTPLCIPCHKQEHIDNPIIDGTSFINFGKE